MHEFQRVLSSQRVYEVEINVFTTRVKLEWSEPYSLAWDSMILVNICLTTFCFFFTCNKIVQLVKIIVFCVHNFNLYSSFSRASNIWLPEVVNVDGNMLVFFSDIIIECIHVKNNYYYLCSHNVDGTTKSVPNVNCTIKNFTDLSCCWFCVLL